MAGEILLGLLCLGLLCIGLYLLHIYMIKEAEKREHYRELAKFFTERELGLLRTNRQKKEDPDDLIRLFFKSHPNKLAEAEQKLKEKKESVRRMREYWKRELIKQRVFFFFYEEMLFQIYAPSAKDSYEDWIPEWLSKDYVVQRISEIKNISIDEALNTFNTLKEKLILVEIPDLGVSLAKMLCDDTDYKDPQWNVVCDIDMTLNKWMDAHGYKHKNN